MIIDFKDIKKEEKPHFCDGEGVAIFQMYTDDKNKIFKLTLNPGCSIGEHTHETSQEIIYLLEGEIEAIDDGQKIVLKEGQANYCKIHHSHGIKNTGNKPAILICSVTNLK